MTAGEELFIVLSSAYLISVLWLSLDAVFGRSKGAARLRAEGATTAELIWMAVIWPILMVGPGVMTVVLSIAEAMRTAKAVLVVAWEEMSGKE